ncbi:UbiA family prenyltransferase [Natrialba sp. INN-245]|uniref:UbiA family prenyltransferase n=1 Tax=Natrialba sp. INN-245 TaxID=2690967 RepID=UPI001312884E|nr:UbiA family prenyltransferase [Natrialba sp. INN-245]MWV39542.1 hypothetical protein [Natrialba sp. INN-245]
MSSFETITPAASTPSIPVEQWFLFAITLAILGTLLVRLLRATTFTTDTDRYQYVIVGAVWLVATGAYVLIDVPGAIAELSALEALPDVAVTIVAWLPFPVGLWIATVGTDLGNVAVHEDRSAHPIRTRVYRRARYLALGIALLSAVVATIYVLVATLGVLGGALVGIAVFVLGSEWVEPHSLAQSGTLREPTENERRRLETLLADAPEVEVPILVYENPDWTGLGVLSVGLPRRRRLVVAAELLADEPLAEGLLAIQAARLESGVHDRRLLAEILRLQALVGGVVVAVPLASPTVELEPLVAVVVGIVGVLWGLDRWVRAGLYDADERSARALEPEKIADAVERTANRLELPRRRTRIGEHVHLAPSINDRLERLRGLEAGDDSNQFGSDDEPPVGNAGDRHEP